jgi:hypothetical protein
MRYVNQSEIFRHLPVARIIPPHPLQIQGFAGVFPCFACGETCGKCGKLMFTGCYYLLQNHFYVNPNSLPDSKKAHRFSRCAEWF